MKKRDESCKGIKKVCMLTARHNPFDARITHKEAVSLRNAGYEVTVVAPIEAARNAPSVYKWTGATFDFQGIAILGYKKKGGLKRKISTVTELIRNGLEVDADIYHCHEADASLLAGIWVKKRLNKRGKKNVKLVYDSHEHWPAAWSHRVHSPLLRRVIYSLVSCWEKWALKSCDCAFTANGIVKEHLVSLKRDIDIQVLYNCPLLTSRRKKHEDHKPSTNDVICHEGTLSFNRGLENMVELIRKARNELNDNIQLLIIGGISTNREREWLNKKIAEYGLGKNVIDAGWLPYDRVGEEIEKCSAGIILFQPTPNNILAGPPNKLFNYMRCGLPVIAPDFCIETRCIISENNCGLLVDSTKLESVYDALRYLLVNPNEAKEMGARGREAILEKYNWGVMERRLIRTYEKL